MQYPFQCIAVVQPPTTKADSGGYLLAASGSRLYSHDLRNGVIVSEWPTKDTEAGPNNTSADAENDQPPAERQKTSTNTSESPKVTKVTVSPDNHHAVIVTDDKCVRVFSINQEGSLCELSQRSMPKRPCAIQVLPDNATILCGDKFGDVYSLPLLLSLNDQGTETQPDGEQSRSAEAATQPFKPSASHLTVHTKRNRQALENQMKQKNLKARSKEPLKFEHQLLLGHVSMLTDLNYGVLEVDGKQRGYILTADRDEHIRASRGPPQSHIIEGYCLGHTQFVSKLCLVAGTDLLISGGGDDWLGVWEWPAFKLKRKLNLREEIRRHIPDSLDKMIAVAGIWQVPMQLEGQSETAMVIACEESPILACVLVSDLLKADIKDPRMVMQTLPHSVLDIVSVGETTLVSFDVRDSGGDCIQAFHLRTMKPSNSQEIRLVANPECQANLKQLSSIAGEEVDDKTLNELLHGVANLRKRSGHGDADDED